MKRAVSVMLVGALALGFLGAGPRAEAGDHEWAVAGKILTGLVVLDALTAPRCSTMVVYQQPVAYYPPVVYSPPVVYGPPVVYRQPVVVYSPVVYHRPIRHPRPHPFGQGFRAGSWRGTRRPGR